MAYLLMPFSASLLYVFGAIYLKDASSRGVGVWRTTVVTNVIFALVFSSLWLMGGRWPEPTAWIQPAVTACLFLGGQVLALIALQRGDVSVATPVMGIKVVLVAFFVTIILGDRVPALVWGAAALSSVGVIFLSRRGEGRQAGGTLPALIYGALAAAAFALFDVLVQKWSPGWGAGRFLPVMMGFVALFSMGLLAVGLEPVPEGAWRPLLLGGLFIAVQGALLITSLAVNTKSTATTINVVYSARGLWSVAVVWAIGHWFGNRERDQGAAVLRARLLGAALLLGAIVLVVAVRR
jgi:drug/metabolite transporter (DMT)-like permease